MCVAGYLIYPPKKRKAYKKIWGQNFPDLEFLRDSLGILLVCAFALIFALFALSPFCLCPYFKRAKGQKGKRAHSKGQSGQKGQGGKGAKWAKTLKLFQDLTSNPARPRG